MCCVIKLRMIFSWASWALRSDHQLPGSSPAHSVDGRHIGQPPVTWDLPSEPGLMTNYGGWFRQALLLSPFGWIPSAPRDLWVCKWLSRSLPTSSWITESSLLPVPVYQLRGLAALMATLPSVPDWGKESIKSFSLSSSWLTMFTSASNCSCERAHHVEPGATQLHSWQTRRKT